MTARSERAQGFGAAIKVRGVSQAAAVAGLLLLLAAGPALAQDDTASATEPSGPDVKQLWEDLLDYIRVANPVAARSSGQAIIESGVDPRELYRLSTETPDALTKLARGAGLEGMEPVLEGVRKIIEEGARLERKDPEQIKGWIEMLGGTIRQFQIAQRRLIWSGEYALPQMIQTLSADGTSETLKERIITVLPKIGREAVRPLSVALQTDDSSLQETLATALAEIQYAHAAPRLKELMEREGVLERTRKIARAALIACAGLDAVSKPAAELYYDTAVKYYYNQDSVAPDPRLEKANVWQWQPGLGLDYQEVPRELLGDIYAMRFTRLALRHDPSFYPAVPLWLSAYLKREADTPESGDPMMDSDVLSAEEFALAASARFLQDVLARGLRDGNAAVASGAIDALAETTGAENLVEPVAGGATSLVEALSFPQRRVRYLAALSLARAMPAETFEGSSLVVTVLQQALRQQGSRVALVVIADEDLRNRVKDAARTAGCEVLDHPDAGRAYSAAHAAAGVDLLVLTDQPDPGSAILRFRQEPEFAALPVLIVSDLGRTRDLAEEHDQVTVVTRESEDAALAAAVGDALQDAGAMDAEEATDWVLQTVEVVRMLGLTSNPVYDISRLESTLAELLGDERTDVRVEAARALATMPSAAAQQAIAGLANDPAADQDVRIAAYGSLSDSVRRHGNLLTEALAAQVVDVVTSKPDPALRTAAARVMGALSLPSEQVEALIPPTDAID